MHMCLHIGIKFEWGDSKKGFSAKWLRAHQANKNPLLHSEIRFSMHGISNWKWLHFYCIASKFSMNRRKERPSILIFLCYYSRNECWIQQKCWLTGRAMYNKKDKHKMEKNDNLSRLNWFLGNWRKIRRKKCMIMFLLHRANVITFEHIEKFPRKRMSHWNFCAQRSEFTWNRTQYEFQSVN